MRYLVVILLALSLIPMSIAQTSIEPIRQNIKDGLYTLVIQVSAPELLEREPNNPEAHFLLAYALYYSNDFTQARLELNQALNLNLTRTPEVDHLDGLLKATEGDRNQALVLLKKAFTQSSDYTPASDLASDYTMASDYNMAMEWGRIAWENQQFQEALEAFAAAAKTTEGKKLMWPELNRGRILHLALQDYDAAIKAYNQAIKTFDDNDPNPGEQPPPGYVEAFFRLGQIYEAKGDIPTAISNYEVARFADQAYEPAIAALKRLAN
jgi:tetratricopeptide (TPR) repeat protein